MKIGKLSFVLSVPALTIQMEKARELSVRSVRKRFMIDSKDLTKLLFKNGNCCINNRKLKKRDKLFRLLHSSQILEKPRDSIKKLQAGI